MKKLFVAFLLGVFALACSNDTATNNGPAAMPTPKVLTGPPVFDDEVAVLETDYGTFKIALYKDVNPLDWEDWRWQLKNRICNKDMLSQIIKLTPEEEKVISAMRIIEPTIERLAFVSGGAGASSVAFVKLSGQR